MDFCSIIQIFDEFKEQIINEKAYMKILKSIERGKNFLPDEVEEAYAQEIKRLFVSHHCLNFKNELLIKNLEQKLVDNIIDIQIFHEKIVGQYTNFKTIIK